MMRDVVAATPPPISTADDVDDNEPDIVDETRCILEMKQEICQIIANENDPQKITKMLEYVSSL